MQGENPLSVEDQTLVAGLLEVVVILWRSVQKALEKNVESQTYITGKFSRVMVKYFHVFTVYHGLIVLIYYLNILYYTILYFLLFMKMFAHHYISKSKARLKVVND